MVLALAAALPGRGLGDVLLGGAGGGAFCAGTFDVVSLAFLLPDVATRGVADHGIVHGSGDQGILIQLLSQIGWTVDRVEADGFIGLSNFTAGCFDGSGHLVRGSSGFRQHELPGGVLVVSGSGGVRRRGPCGLGRQE